MEENAFCEKHMGTEVSILLTTNSPAKSELLARQIFAKISKAEQMFSRFIVDSELSRLNKQKKLTVSDMFIEVLLESIKLTKETEGNFNPLIQVAKLGYVDDYPLLKNNPFLDEIVPYNLDISGIKIDRGNNEVSLGEKQNLDFGGILKGYLAEKIVAEINLDQSLTGIILNLGGDLYTKGNDSSGNPFTFFLYNPVIQDEVEITLSDTSLVTSGSYKRQWQTSFGTSHHIISADGISNAITTTVAASVIHKSGSTAEAFAKYLLNTKPNAINKDLLPKDLRYYLFQTDGNVITSQI